MRRGRSPTSGAGTAHVPQLAIKELDTVACSVDRVEPATARDLLRIRPLDREARREQGRCGGINVDNERGVSLSGGPEVMLDSHVQLTVGSPDPRNAKPAASTLSQRRRLRQLFPSEGTCVEPSLR